MDNITQQAAQATILYFDASVEWLNKHTEYGFVHPISGDMLSKIRTQRAVLGIK